jgi:hypothetical protein
MAASFAKLPELLRKTLNAERPARRFAVKMAEIVGAVAEGLNSARASR